MIELCEGYVISEIGCVDMNEIMTSPVFLPIINI